MANYFCTDSVEEQVDYLTDKVKDLNTKKLDKAAVVQATGTGTDVVMSQKAVTDVINENLQTVNESLQTINTELSNKLAKPNNPSAESAVTMLADGTVGTKLLSEIGGSGGGKIYRHEITVEVDENSNLYFYFTDNVKNYSTFKDIPIKNGVGYYKSNTNADCPAAFKIDVSSNNMLCIYITTMNITNPSAGVQYTDIYKDFGLITYTDTAIQL